MSLLNHLSVSSPLKTLSNVFENDWAVTVPGNIPHTQSVCEENAILFPAQFLKGSVLHFADCAYLCF